MPRIELRQEQQDMRFLKDLLKGYYLIDDKGKTCLISINGGVIHYHSESNLGYDGHQDPRMIQRRIIGKVKDFKISNIELEK